MQTTFSKRRLFFPSLFLMIIGFCAGCAERLPEEAFDILPTGDFPHLGHVPDRPQLPALENLSQLEKKLTEDAQTSGTLKQDVFTRLTLAETTPQ